MARRWFGAMVLVGLAAVGFAVSGRTSSDGALPTALVERGTFEDLLPVRGDIRPSRSIVLTAPSSGADLQIVELAPNGSPIKRGATVVAFDTTPQQRTREQKESELKQADAELERVRAEGERRVRAAEAELERLADALIVPTAAIFSRDGATVVYVVERGGPVARPVSIAKRGQERTAIASGVAEGERIALRDPTLEVVP